MATKNNKTPSSEAMTEERSAPTAVGGQQQAELFNQAMALFHQREFRRAMPLFEAAGNGPVREMAYSARTHWRMCESRLARTEPDSRSAEDNYTHAIAQMNLRSFADAALLLDVSLRQQETDYAHYAAAVARGYLGQVEAAAGHLRRAIQLQPRNRTMAMNDPDFVELAKLQPIREVLTGS